MIKVVEQEGEEEEEEVMKKARQYSIGDLPETIR